MSELVTGTEVLGYTQMPPHDYLTKKYTYHLTT